MKYVAHLTNQPEKTIVKMALQLCMTSPAFVRIIKELEYMIFSLLDEDINIPHVEFILSFPLESVAILEDHFLVLVPCYIPMFVKSSKLNIRSNVRFPPFLMITNVFTFPPFTSSPF